MPIVIDTNDTQDVTKQVKQINKKLKVNKQVDAKYFSKSLTGAGNRKDGVFPHGGDTFKDFAENRRRLLEDVFEDESHKKTMQRIDNQVFGNFFHQSSKSKETDFRKFENSLTTMLPPVLIYDLINLYSETVALSFPKNTPMYNMRNMENNWEVITTGTIDGQAATIYAKPVIQSMRLYSREMKHTSKSGHVAKTMTVSGQPESYVIFATILDDMDPDGDIIFMNNLDEDKDMAKVIDSTQGVASIAYLEERNRWSYDFDALSEKLDRHIDYTIGNQSVNLTNIGAHPLELIIGDISMSDTLKEQAILMNQHAGEALLSYTETIAKRASELQRKAKKYPHAIKHMANNLVAFVQHIDLLNNIEDNIVSTDLLAKIYNAFNDNLDNIAVLHKIARHSLRLLLSQRLHELDEIRNNNGLYEFKPDDDTVNDAMKANPNYSTQQKRIITTTDPLVIGQAGAGSGKSHTLVGRINYMIDQGEDVSKVLVLSFTNVAALNISQRFPGVRSETLANMFHTIYSATFPQQSLSQPSTVANSMRLLNTSSQYFKNLGIAESDLQEFIREFAIRLEQFDQTGFKKVDLQQELKRLSNLIEGNLELTSMVLNAVEQTTLELEPIIIHHKLLNGGDGLNIPQEYQDLNYIITDESQDISTFEYILLLELTIHYRSQLLIIGDGSQTLYEFRNSDPRYMNALESSNVFTSHKLETNYRSNEEILMYANQFLQVIDANKYANIQLKSSTFSTPTEKSVNEAITVADNELTNGTRNTDYNNNLTAFIEEDVEFHEWFIKRVKKGEQVAFMGWTRSEVVAVGESIKELLNKHNLGHIEITNIMSDNERPMTILSKFSHEKSSDLRRLDPSHAHYLSEIDDIADQFVKSNFRHATPKQAVFYIDYINRNIRTVTQSREWQAWVSDYNHGNLSSAQVGGFVIQALIRLETRKNAMDQYLRKQKDVPNYDKCPILLSTIHGTKGLEFDHTVVMFNEAKRAATSQESLRMMFVALSRAKKSEFIINSYKPSNHRTIGGNLSDMLRTPMRSALVRTLDDVRKLNMANAQNAALSTDDEEDE